MKFLIGKATSEQLAFGNNTDLFVATNGSLYNFEVKYEEDEMITITDKIGRYMPLDITDVKALAEVLCRIDRFQETKTLIRVALINELAYGEHIVA